MWRLNKNGRKKCSKCDLPFTCGNEKPGCWCESLSLGAAALEELKTEFENCLCPACLTIYAMPVNKKN